MRRTLSQKSPLLKLLNTSSDYSSKTRTAALNTSRCWKDRSAAILELRGFIGAEEGI
jgi:hypothetical protein